jgi:hypothetical protein
MIYGRKRPTHQRDLQLDEVAVGESLCAPGEDHGRTDSRVQQVRTRGELEEVVVQAEKTAEGRGLTTETRRAQSKNIKSFRKATTNFNGATEELGLQYAAKYFANDDRS